jgi:hypothetical protein
MKLSTGWSVSDLLGGKVMRPMNRTERALLAFITLLLLISFCRTLCSGFSTGLCENYIYQQAISPNGEYRVVVFQRDCGATTGFSTNLALLGTNEALGQHSGNMLRASGHPDWFDIEVEWQDDTHVTITHNGKWKPSKQKDVLRGVHISYVAASENAMTSSVGQDG